jgi:hypothetical protein
VTALRFTDAGLLLLADEVYREHEPDDSGLCPRCGVANCRARREAAAYRAGRQAGPNVAAIEPPSAPDTALDRLVASARDVAGRHQPVDELVGPCRQCGHRWPCRAYCSARRLLRELGARRPAGRAPDES